MSRNKGVVRIYNKKKQVFDGIHWRPCCSTESCNNRTTRDQCKKCSNPLPQEGEIKYTNGKGGKIKRIYRGRRWCNCCKKCDGVTVTIGNDVCLKCKTGKSRKKYKSTKDHREKKHRKFLEKCRLMCPNISLVGNYINNSTPIEALCKIHNKTFKQRPNKMMIGQLGCKICLKEKRIRGRRKSHEDFVKEAREIHGNSFDYPEEYKGAHVLIDILCIEHNVKFKQSPHGHVGQGQNGCSKCCKYGKMEGDYAKFIAITENKPNLQYTLSKNNPGQKKILNFKIDVYDGDTKTCYEFNGCRWHGCPCRDVETQRRKEEEIMKKRFLNTQQRKDTIEKEGYKVISMRQCDWTRRNKLLKSIIIEYSKNLNVI